MTRDPQAVLDVLEFYADRQQRELEMEEMAQGLTPGMSRSASTATSNTLSPYDTGTPSAPRFNAGTGLAGSGKPAISAPMNGQDPRQGMSRQESAPSGLNGKASTSTAIAAARAAEFVNSQHVNTISSSSARPGLPLSPNSLTPSRPAPPAPQRPLLTAARPAPPAPGQKPPVPDHTPSSADLRARAKAQGPDRVPPGLDQDQIIPQRKDSLPSRDHEGQRPHLPPSKSSPATSQPATQPAAGPAGALVGPPPIKPLQPTKKLPKNDNIQQPAIVTVTPADDEKDKGGVAAAAAALEKPKEKERRISTMSEAQIMEKLRSVVCPDDPKAQYSKIKKIGQG